MVFVVCGLNHKTAPLDVRERFALPLAVQASFLEALLQLPFVTEVALLSTCNRIEVYGYTEAPERFFAWIANYFSLDGLQSALYLYHYQKKEGIRHLLRVAAGLDSMMLGEPQIFGQMKEAYRQASKLGVIKTELHALFQYVFKAAKYIRTQSGINEHPISVAYAAVRLIGEFFPDYKRLKVFIIGSGDTSSLVAQHLHAQGVSQFILASRVPAHAQPLAEKVGGRIVSIADIADYLPEADILVSATACPLPFINKNMVEKALIQRAAAPMFLLDLAVPRDIEEDVALLKNVLLYNIDDLQALRLQGMKERETAALTAESLIEEALIQYKQVAPDSQTKEAICHYRFLMETLAEKEAEWARKKLDAGLCKYEVLERFKTRLLKKLLHQPTQAIREAALKDEEDRLQLAQSLMNSQTRLSPYEEIS